MHQHPRAPPASASPALSDQTNPTRTNNPRDRDLNALRTNSPLTQGSGSSEDFQPREQHTDPAAQMQRLNQVIQNFHTKAALIILHSRVDLAPAYAKNSDTKRVNRWFNIELEETDDYREDIRRWKTCDVKDDRPPPLNIEVFLTTDTLPQGQRLVILDEDGKRWDVMNALESSDSRYGKRRDTESTEILLERWTIELGDQTAPLPPDMATVLPLVYKKSIVLFRALFTYCNFLPAWKLSRRLGRSRSTMAMKIGYRFVSGQSTSSLTRSDNLNLPLTDGSNDVVSDYSFGTAESPAGPFSVRVTYRQNCDFRIDDSEELLSSRFLGTDDDLFRPSMPSDQEKKDRSRTDMGSLPNDRRSDLFQRPELGHAYGSLSTFHQAGIGTGTSPLSALRSAKDYSTASPPTPDQARPAPQPQPSTSSSSSRNSLRAQAAGRRSSFSFQPFKQPTLSASPLGASPLGTSPRLASGHVPTLSSLTEEAARPAPNAHSVAARKPSSLSEHAVTSSTSSSPKPTPTTRYSSSFSHRRARLSSGGTTMTKTDEDQNSSGRASAASSAQPGSGLLTEAVAAGGSSDSMQEDDESIQDFLKLLDTKKDLLNPEDAAAAETSTRRTAAALNRFHRMRDSNTALSDSLSSSMMLHRSSSSSSRQLSSVPPMVAATSASTSSSPGKPISPHTPHTPFAPSRLSAAYSHDDDPHGIAIEEEPPSPSEAATSDTAQARSNTNVNAIDIPHSPRPFLDNYRRSSSAQRRPLSDEIRDAYGMRSASMGAQDRRAATRTETPLRATITQEPEESPELTERRPQTAAPALAADGASESGSGSHSAIPYHPRRARGSGRGATPPHGSTSSFGGTGSADKSAGDSGSASGSWRGHGRMRPGSRPDNTLTMDEDETELFPFAMERSDFQSSGGKET
ncbi:uncharacterized protein HMPREF1541_05415 [Cyphellophora europaea CBS 101466]|uniref:Autophagy-related protein 13 n=1 Tax=Cyphellophora europaea (strain CBS 101466) TaxID=1220924 RepID=W2RRV3_CYPE1|nr:uncharacterized protein HMPREF1541_05415 [Cyphellophora europaea CBS 101466]ETN39192.1 hypothetical protein HMPREF1541_05415 [Cyphellophora europaea CBS 101466]